MMQTLTQDEIARVAQMRETHDDRAADALEASIRGTKAFNAVNGGESPPTRGRQGSPSCSRGGGKR